MMSDPGPPAAWRPALSSAGLGVAGNLPTLSLGLMWTDDTLKLQLITF